MVAFKLASQGKLVQTTSAIANISPVFNLSCYSVAGDDGATYVTIINKDNLDNTSTVRSANVTVSLPSTYTISSVQSCQLLGTGNSIVPGDISNKSGITIGGKVINSDGTWTGGFSNGALNLVQSQPNVIGLSVPPASATVLKLLTSIVPDAPNGLGVTPLSDSQLGLNWSESTGEVTSYQIQISPDGKSWTTLTSLPAASQPTVINSNSYQYIVANLNPSTTYFFQVSCTSVGETSTYSTSVSNTTGASIGDGIPGWWRLQYFGNGLSIIAGVSGPQDDPGSSGIPNLLAYATGISPIAVNSTLVTNLDASTTRLELKFNRIEPPTLSYTIEASPDLAVWTGIAWLTPGGSSWSGPATMIPVVETGTGTARAVTVTDSQLKTVSPCRFLRLSVTK